MTAKHRAANPVSSRPRRQLSPFWRDVFHRTLTYPQRPFPTTATAEQARAFDQSVLRLTAAGAIALTGLVLFSLLLGWTA